MLSLDARRILLRLARDAIHAGVSGGPALRAEPTDELAILAGAFVTIHHRGALRGCIGSTDRDRPLVEVVVRCAVAAALDDPRFPPLSAAELGEIDLEISVLTPPEPVSDPADVEVGRHGLIVEQGVRHGLLLPQVAIEWGWDRETFLSRTCIKAGLAPDAWRAGATILRFEAHVFGERDEERG
jgi:AmmeMemoRadiSam system protein A